MAKRLKAYKVDSGNDEGHSCIVFATNNASARRKGAAEFDLCFEEVERCRRASEFDEYASQGDVPPLVLIKHGWWFECHHCGCQVDDENFDYEEDRERGEPVSTSDGAVYCCAEHRALHWAELTQRQARQHAAIEAASIKFHGWPISRISASGHYWPDSKEPLSAEFDFPGRNGALASWPIGDDMTWISECDRDAWNAMKATFSIPSQGTQPGKTQP